VGWQQYTFEPVQHGIPLDEPAGGGFGVSPLPHSPAQNGAVPSQRQVPPDALQQNAFDPKAQATPNGGP
jgi:hypothetical protein